MLGYLTLVLAVRAAEQLLLRAVRAEVRPTVEAVEVHHRQLELATQEREVALIKVQLAVEAVEAVLLRPVHFDRAVPVVAYLVLVAEVEQQELPLVKLVEPAQMA